MQTAAPVAEVLGLVPRTDDRLMELNAGVFQGLTWAEINQRVPAEGDAWKSQNPDYRYPRRRIARAISCNAAARRSRRSAKPDISQTLSWPTAAC